MNRLAALEKLARRHGVLAVYRFGSRAEEGLRRIAAEELLPIQRQIERERFRVSTT